MTAEHSKEKDFSRYVEFVSAVLRTKKDKANSRPKKQQVAIENTSKAIQLELFPFNVAFPWFKPYMDQS